MSTLTSVNYVLEIMIKCHCTICLISFIKSLQTNYLFPYSLYVLQTKGLRFSKANIQVSCCCTLPSRHISPSFSCAPSPCCSPPAASSPPASDALKGKDAGYLFISSHSQFKKGQAIKSRERDSRFFSSSSSSSSRLTTSLGLSVSGLKLPPEITTLWILLQKNKKASIDSLIKLHLLDN